MFSRISNATAGMLFTLLAGLGSDAWAATITVDVSSDGSGTAGQCELRDAILAANTDSAVDGCAAGSGADLVVFSINNASILLNDDLPAVSNSLEIVGPGTEALIIDGDDNYTQFRVFSGADEFTLRGVQLFQGLGALGGCLYAESVDVVLIEDVRFDTCHATLGGGGASFYHEAAESTVTLRRVYVNGSSTDQSGGGISLSAGTATIEDSLFLGNRANAVGGTGGGMTAGRSTDLTISRSTFSANSAYNAGSAIQPVSPGVVLHIRHSTFSQNNLLGNNINYAGGAINNEATLDLFNAVVAGNLSANTFHDRKDINNAAGATLTTLGYNLIGTNDGAAAIFPAGVQANGDQAGTSGTPLDALLGALQDNGGPTLTSLPASNSPAVDQGSCPGEIFDQRGYGNATSGLRPVLAGGSIADDGCDTGAVEYLAMPPLPLSFEDGFEDL